MTDTDIEVTLEPTPTNGAVPPIVAILPEVEDKPDPAVEDLREQLKALEASEAAAKTAAEQAQTQAREHEAELTRLRESESSARKSTVESQLDAVSNAEAAANAEADGAARDYATAMESADYAKAATAQRAMARAEGKLLQLGQAKADLEEARKAPAPQPKATVSANPTEAFIQSRTPATQTWLRSHMEVLTNPELNAIATGADAEARRKGIVMDSEAYFKLIETRLGYAQEEEIVPEPEVKPAPTQQRKPVRTPPVSREVNGNNGQSMKVKLSAEEALSATDGTHVWDRYDQPVIDGKIRAGTPIGHQEFARRKQHMLMNGDYTRKTEDE